jgi:hypothetical protein
MAGPVRTSQRFLVTFVSVLCATAFAAAPDPGSPCRSHGLGFGDKGVAWKHVPLSKLKRDTVYRVVQEGERSAVLHATADRSASLYVAALKPP